MKFKNIKYFIIASIASLTLGACSSDFLDTKSEGGATEEQVYGSTKNIQLAVNGLAKLMVTQYESQGYNGEGTMKLYYGEYMGSNFRLVRRGTTEIINGSLIESNSNSFGRYPWHYYYMIIRNANMIIDRVDQAEGPQSDKEYLKAQALTYRAYAYSVLVQLYGERWVDSKGGTTPSVPLRLSPSDANSLSVASSKEVYDQVYKDLDEAIKLFDKSNFVRKADKFYYINKDVTHAIFARVALTKQDYELAARHANLAKANYKLMSVADYKSGFANPTSEWIWGSYGADNETLHFYSYFSYIAYNSSSNEVNNYPRRISKELYEQIPTTDIRRDMFIDGSKYKKGSFKEDTGLASSNSQLAKDARANFPDLNTKARIAAYMQFKFKANGMPGVGNMNHFRSSEMYLIEAEALHKLGRDSEAASLLTELNVTSKRDPKYKCTLTGDDLFKEIVKYRGIELWGEGFDWYDRKRWKMPIVRLSVKDGGNITVDLDGVIEPTDNNNWKFSVPLRETDFK